MIILALGTAACDRAPSEGSEARRGEATRAASVAEPLAPQRGAAADVASPAVSSAVALTEDDARALAIALHPASSSPRVEHARLVALEEVARMDHPPVSPGWLLERHAGLAAEDPEGWTARVPL